MTEVSIIISTCNVTCYNDSQVFLKHQIGNLENNFLNHLRCQQYCFWKLSNMQLKLNAFLYANLFHSPTCYFSTMLLIIYLLVFRFFNIFFIKLFLWIVQTAAIIFLNFSTFKLDLFLWIKLLLVKFCIRNLFATEYLEKTWVIL